MERGIESKSREDRRLQCVAWAAISVMVMSIAPLVLIFLELTSSFVCFAFVIVACFADRSPGHHVSCIS